MAPVQPVRCTGFLLRGQWVLQTSCIHPGSFLPTLPSEQWSPGQCLEASLCYTARMPAPSFDSLLPGEGAAKSQDGQGTRAQKESRSQKGVAAEAASSSTSRGTPVLSVSLLTIQMKSPLSGADFREIRLINFLYVYETISQFFLF